MVWPPPESFPMDLVGEILARLPVKPIVRLRCVCKLWDALISDPHFAKKQLQRTGTDPTRHHVIVTSCQRSTLNMRAMDFSLQPLLHSKTSSQFNLFFNEGNIVPIVSCNGMLLCHPDFRRTPFLCNPAAGKSKYYLPPLEGPINSCRVTGFGYDDSSETYKVVCFFVSYDLGDNGNVLDVMVHTLGTNYWRRPSQKFPSNNVHIGRSVEFVSGTLNLVIKYKNNSSSRAVVSLDLGKEKYEELLLPHSIDENQKLSVHVLKGCLCILAHSSAVAHVWVMNEYGNIESWTKVIRIPLLERFTPLRLLWISEENDQILLQDEWYLAVYNSKTGTSYKKVLFRESVFFVRSILSVESLVSPCS